MVKKTKRYNRHRRQKGGFLGFFEEEKDINGNATTDTGFFSNLKMPELPNLFTSSTPSSGSSYPTPTSSYPTPTSTYPTPTSSYPTPASNSYGGRRRSKRMRGGIGASRGLGLTYYASPVHDIKVAEPTYMEYYKGGRRHKSRKCRKTCRKSHRHCRK
jgi:hypothetical protein